MEFKVVIPAGPVAPVAPLRPWSPCLPCGPSWPVAPVRPGGPCGNVSWQNSTDSTKKPWNCPLWQTYFLSFVGYVVYFFISS